MFSSIQYVFLLKCINISSQHLEAAIYRRLQQWSLLALTGLEQRTFIWWPFRVFHDSWEDFFRGAGWTNEECYFCLFFVTFQASSYTMDLFVVIVSPSLHTYFTLEAFSLKWIGTFKFGSNNFNIKYINRRCDTPS